MVIKSRSLFFLTFTIIFSLVLSACGAPSTPVGSIAPSEPAGDVIPPIDVNKSITIVIPEDPPSFNPFVADTGYDSLVMELVMLGLADLDPNGNAFPELAAELPSLVEWVNANSGVIFILWDEGNGGLNIPIIAAGPGVKKNYESLESYDHGSLTKTVETIFGLPILPAVQEKETFSDMFEPGQFP